MGLNSVVSFNNGQSNGFSVTRGTKQGSIISPQLFNLFLNDLLLCLSQCSAGARVGDLHVNSFAYADDVSVFAPTVTGLQQLINICHDYASTWRFKFGLKKTKVMAIGKQLLKSQPTCYLGNDIIEYSSSLEILGITFTPDLKSTAHVDKRVKACRKSMFNLSSVGYSPTGLTPATKTYLWKTTGLPTLCYGLETQYINKGAAYQIESTQASSDRIRNGYS